MYQAVIIDDEPYIVEGLVKAIDWNGYHIEIGLASTNPSAVLDYILHHPVDILITDVDMPVMNGIQLIKKLKEHKPSLYVIVLSAYDNFEYARAALRYGAENYLLKPLDPDELSDTISQIISHIQERELLDSTYGRAMMTFRSTFTEQWLKNLLNTSELTTRAELLGIDLNAESFTVVIFSCLESGESMMSRFLDFFLQYLPGYYTANFFFETPLRLVGVLSPATNAITDIREFLTPIMDSAAAHGITIFASVGTTVTHCSKVHHSYHQAAAFLFLEYSQLPYVFYECPPGLIEAAEDAMNHYTSSNGENVMPIRELFTEYDITLCSYHILSKRIRTLCENGFDLLSGNNKLLKLLNQLPPSSGNPLVYQAITLQFLAQSNPSSLEMQKQTYPMVDAVLKMIHEFSDKEISLKTLAARLNVSPAYLGAMFRQQTGCYFNDYLTEARLKYAADLLEHTDMKIKDIADKVGFTSQTYFNRSFKRIYDISPVSYRRNKSIENIT